MLKTVSGTFQYVLNEVSVAICVKGVNLDSVVMRVILEIIADFFLGDSFGRRDKLVSVGESEKDSTKEINAVSFDVNLMTTLSTHRWTV